MTGQKAAVEVVSKVCYEKIDQALIAGHPVITKVFIDNAVNHWVLIVGKNGVDYLIKDSLGDGETLEKLSKYDSNIYAIRILKQMNE